MRFRAVAALCLLIAALAAGRADAAGSGRIAALQVALRAHNAYAGTIDGVRGPGTIAGVRRFQRRHHLTVDGVAGPQTRRALGRLGRHPLGSRALHSGAVGWDVSALQFLLAWHGFPSGSFDGGFGSHTDTAVRRFQRWSGLGADGVAGPATLRALRGGVPRSPISVRRPVAGPVGDGFGPRGNRFHAGLDFPVAYGTRVRAARSGRVLYAGWDSGGFGNLVVIGHVAHVRTFYAHLSSISVRRGQHVRAGWTIGRVGATGSATGPHLHFEVHYRGASVNPLSAL
jgi:peptidoglycan hydrolase-like protein with peptidoglycan-binding domain